VIDDAEPHTEAQSTPSAPETKHHPPTHRLSFFDHDLTRRRPQLCSFPMLPRGLNMYFSEISPPLVRQAVHFLSSHLRPCGKDSVNCLHLTTDIEHRELFISVHSRCHHIVESTEKQHIRVKERKVRYQQSADLQHERAQPWGAHKRRNIQAIAPQIQSRSQQFPQFFPHRVHRMDALAVRDLGPCSTIEIYAIYHHSCHHRRPYSRSIANSHCTVGRNAESLGYQKVWWET
jgi:hypothetical protein